MVVSDKGFTVKRTEDKSVVWNTDLQTGQLVVESQYLEITNQFQRERPDVFGLGERDAGLQMRFDTPYVMFAQVRWIQMPIRSRLSAFAWWVLFQRHHPHCGQWHGWNAVLPPRM